MEFWNHQACDRNNMDFGSYGDESISVSVSGTNEIGGNIGCK